MDIDPLDTFPRSHVQHGKNVGQVAVHATVRQQAEYMKRMAALLRIPDRLEIDGVFKEVPVFNLEADFRQDLKHHAAGADVGMADLRVAHLPLRQTDIQAGGLELGVRKARKQCVQIRFVCDGYRIARRRRGNAITVHDDQTGAIFDLCLHIPLIPEQWRR